MKTFDTSLSEATKSVYSTLLMSLKEDPLRFLDLAGVLIVVISSDKRIVYMNKKGHELLGCIGEDVQGLNWFENFIPSRNRKAVESVFEKIMAGEIKSVEFYENPVVSRS
jgi:PAS domain S-box-containing protein